MAVPMGLLSFLRSSNPNEKTAIAIYLSIVAQARTPTFYAALGVPDSLNGRFDLIVLHAMLAMRRIRAEGIDHGDLLQALFDYMFKDMDRSLREVGVGDMSVGKHIKKMAKAFYGRAAEYELAMDNSDDAAISEALKLNLYRSSEPSDAHVKAMVRYIHQADSDLKSGSFKDLCLGRLSWPTSVEL